MSAQAPCVVIPPPGYAPGAGKDSSYCKAYRAGLKAWCDDEKKGRKGDFNSYVFRKLHGIDRKLWGEISRTRELPIGVLTGAGPQAFGALGAAGRAAAKMVEASAGLAASGVSPSAFRFFGSLAVREKLPGMDVQRVLCPDARTPDGRPIEIKRPSEPESHDDQRNNYAACANPKECVGLDAQSCIGKGTYKKDCPPPT